MDKRVFILIILLLGLVSVGVAQAVGSQGNEYLPAYSLGENHGRNDVSVPLWIGIGCVTGGASALYPLLASPNVPQAILIGQSEEFVAGYSDGYIKGHKQAIQNSSCIGGVVGWGCLSSLYLLDYFLYGLD